MNNQLTIVSALYDLGRDQLKTFSRSFEFYKEKLKEFLISTKDNPIIFFCEKELNSFIYEYRDTDSIYIINKKLEDFKIWFEFYKEIQEIRKQPKWYSQAGWLKESPQAKLEFYNPLVMSKMFLLNDATIYNPFNSEYFIWLDSGITNTVHYGYFSHDKILEKLPSYLNDFLFLSFPYDSYQVNEIHGFEKNAFLHFSKPYSEPNQRTTFVCRGGLFGGKKDKIRELNGLYYSLLKETLSSGCMGTEENIFTLLFYRYPSECQNVNRFSLNQDGLISTFCEAIKNNNGHFEKNANLFSINQKENINESKTGMYILTFNYPEQLELMLSYMKKNQPEFLSKPKRKILIDNSNQHSYQERNKEIASRYEFEVINKDNIGICSGRQFVAEHFNEQNDLDYYIFFEDDMLFVNNERIKENNDNEESSYCQFGFSIFKESLYDSIHSIFNKEKLDFLKLTFSEFYGNNSDAWAWYNITTEDRKEFFPEQPIKKDNVPIPKTRIDYISSFDHIPYAIGNFHFCNWPILMSKEGSRKIFLNPVYQYPHEATLMSHTYRQQMINEIKSGCLLLSPIQHHRMFHYLSERIECS